MMNLYRSSALVAAVLIGTSQLAAQLGTSCPAPLGAPRIDHAVLVVHDLESAADRLAAFGFQVKHGRLHSDGLTNRHIKFRDGSGIELMSLAGSPRSAMARDYSNRLSSGEGGAFAALRLEEFQILVAAVEAEGLHTRITRAGAWEFLSFPARSDGDALFFLRGGSPVTDSDSLVSHRNRASGLAGLWIEAGPTLDRLLRRLGATPCWTVPLPDGRTGTRWMLTDGSLVLVRPRTSGRPRLLGAELRVPTEDPARAPRVVELYAGFWLMF